MRVGEAITRLGDELEALSAARARHWPARGEEPGLPPADTKAALERLRRERAPVIRAIRDELSRGLTGLRTEGRGAPGDRPPRGTVAAALQEIDPELLAHSSESRVQARGSLAPDFFTRYAPAPRAGAELPYLFLQVTAGFWERPKVWHAHRWVFRYGFTCFEPPDRKQSDGHLGSLRRVAAAEPERLLTALRLILDDGPGRWTATRDMHGMEPHPLEDAADLEAWLGGKRPGLLRAIEGETADARRLGSAGDAELMAEVRRFLRVCAIHLLQPTWQRGYVSGGASVFLSYRRRDASQEVARSVRMLLKERGVTVFLDEQDFGAGDDWRERLPHQIEQSHVFVALAGPAYFGDITPSTTTEGDIVMQELVTALRFLRRPPAGFLLDGAKMPAPEQLPPELRNVHSKNFRPVREADPEAGAREVVAHLVDLGVVP